MNKPAELQSRGGFWLQVGDKQVHIGIERLPDRSRQHAHVAFEVTDLGTLRKRLEEAHVEVVEAVPIPGFERFEVRDLSGNRLEFIQRTRA